MHNTEATCKDNVTNLSPQKVTAKQPWCVCRFSFRGTLMCSLSVHGRTSLLHSPRVALASAPRGLVFDAVDEFLQNTCSTASASPREEKLSCFRHTPTCRPRSGKKDFTHHVQDKHITTHTALQVRTRLEDSTVLHTTATKGSLLFDNLSLMH